MNGIVECVTHLNGIRPSRVYKMKDFGSFLGRESLCCRLPARYTAAVSASAVLCCDD